MTKKKITQKLDHTCLQCGKTQNFQGITQWSEKILDVFITSSWETGKKGAVVFF